MPENNQTPLAVQTAISNLQGAVKRNIYPKTVDSAVYTTNAAGAQTTLDNVLIKGIKYSGSSTVYSADSTTNLVTLPAGSGGGTSIITIEGSVEGFYITKQTPDLGNNVVLSTLFNNTVTQFSQGNTLLQMILTDSSSDNSGTLVVPMYYRNNETSNEFYGETIWLDPYTNSEYKVIVVFKSNAITYTAIVIGTTQINIAPASGSISWSDNTVTKDMTLEEIQNIYGILDLHGIVELRVFKNNRYDTGLFRTYVSLTDYSELQDSYGVSVELDVFSGITIHKDDIIITRIYADITEFWEEVGVAVDAINAVTNLLKGLTSMVDTSGIVFKLTATKIPISSLTESEQTT